MTEQYDIQTQQKIRQVLQQYERGELKMGGSGKTVTSRKQALAIAFSEARKKLGVDNPPEKVPKSYMQSLCF